MARADADAGRDGKVERFSRPRLAGLWSFSDAETALAWVASLVTMWPRRRVVRDLAARSR